MADALRRDYDDMAAMIFGTAPEFADIIMSMREIEAAVNG